MAPGELNSTGERRILEKHRLLRLKDDLWLFVRAHWKTVLAGIVGFVIGYWKLRSDIGDAITAAHTAQAAASQLAGQVDDLREEFDQLATRQAVDLTNKRIDDWNSWWLAWYAGAQQIAGEQPLRGGARPRAGVLLRPPPPPRPPPPAGRSPGG